MISAAAIEPIIAQVPRLRSWVIPYKNPAAYKSPAPVESTTSFTISASTKVLVLPLTTTEPLIPLVMAAISTNGLIKSKLL